MIPSARTSVARFLLRAGGVLVVSLLRSMKFLALLLADLSYAERRLSVFTVNSFRGPSLAICACSVCQIAGGNESPVSTYVAGKERVKSESASLALVVGP
jgi:hypothetical protein